jgi:hypothetical protein
MTKKAEKSLGIKLGLIGNLRFDDMEVPPL